MPESLTETQKKIFEFIEKRVETDGIPPTIKEIAAACDLSSSSSVHHQLKVLEKKGYITRNSKQSRSIQIIEKKNSENQYIAAQNKEYPLIAFKGSITPECKSIYSLPVALTGSSDAFLYKIETEELTDIGIHRGDIAIIEYNSEPNSEDIALAITGNRIEIRKAGTLEEHTTFIGVLKSIIRRNI